MNSSSLEESPGTKTLFQSVFPGPVLTRFVDIFPVNCEENKSRMIPIVKAKLYCLGMNSLCAKNANKVFRTA